ncbi:Coiled-coil domain-containing protein 53 [Pteropus alecto]|uniref:WASH complex subunit 3 n=1 Tax=Pteropus alecto TaxID=9402 RepID=L5KII1_PTEAL|nr:Coiled-coil domain-containing protein 53 [Pteropus alecto]
MDEDGLPLMGSGIDLTKVPAIQQKRTVAFLNQFVVHTVQFLNRFSTVCEEKLADLSLRIQQIETTLNILDAKLSSIPGLDDVTFEVSPVSVSSITNESHSETISERSQQNSLQDSGPQESEVTAENILTVAKDPRYARYLKMIQVGVPVMAIRNKMISEGLDPDLLERPDAPVPDGEETDQLLAAPPSLRSSGVPAPEHRGLTHPRPAARPSPGGGWPPCGDIHRILLRCCCRSRKRGPGEVCPDVPRATRHGWDSHLDDVHLKTKSVYGSGWD